MLCCWWVEKVRIVISCLIKQKWNLSRVIVNWWHFDGNSSLSLYRYVIIIKRVLWRSLWLCRKDEKCCSNYRLLYIRSKLHHTKDNLLTIIHNITYLSTFEKISALFFSHTHFHYFIIYFAYQPIRFIWKSLKTCEKIRQRWYVKHVC